LTLLDISLQNLRRRSSRAMLVILCLVVAVGMMTAMVISNRALQSSISSKMDEYGANIVIAPRSEQLALSYGGMMLPGVTTNTPEFDGEVLSRIASVRDGASIISLAPKAVGAVDLEGFPVLLVGVDFAREIGMKKWWRLDGRVPDAGSDVLIGSSIASDLGKKAGDRIMLGGKAFDVAAVLSPTGSSEDDVIMADLETTQAMLGRGDRLTFVEVTAEGAAAERVAAQISAAVPEARVTALKQAIEGKKQVMERFVAFGMALSALVLVASGFSVLTMMISSVHQRTREIGILRAVGYRRSHIAVVMLSEAVLLSLAGGLGGFAAGSGLGRLIATRLLDVSQVQAASDALLIAVSLSLAVGLAAAAYPAFRAASIDPARALRFV
jgi:putative ABC transport system permease protein